MEISRIHGTWLASLQRLGWLRRHPAGRWAALALLAGGVLLALQMALAATFTVNSTGDETDASPGNGVCATAAGTCTLRAAIQEANASLGSHTINFNLPGCGTGPSTGTPGTGLLGSYFNTINLTGSVVLTRNEAVDFNWGNGSPAAAVAKDNFSARWTGTVTFPTTGTYRFQTNSDDGVRLWVNGALIIDNWTDHAPLDNTSGSLSFTAGQTATVRLEWYERGGGAVIRLRWQTPSAPSSYVAIPISALTPGTGVDSCTIQPASALPTLSRTVVINGQSQPGWSSSPLVELNGASAGSSSKGLTVQGSGSVVRGLTINRFAGCAVSLEGSGGHQVAGNHIGTTTTGSAAASGNGAVGVCVNSPGNTVGGTGANDRNVIGGFLQVGATQGRAIDIINGANGNTIAGNHLGVGADGSTAVPNQQGLLLTDGSNNTIGGSTVAARNVISGNQGAGITVQAVAGTPSGNRISGNFIGTTAAGTAALANGGTGVSITGGSGTVVGGSVAGAGNLISGNGARGVLQNGEAVTGTVISGNTIGLNLAGTSALPNASYGVQVLAGGGATIGGTSAAERNLISGNTSSGVLLGTAGSVVRGNWIGVNAAGTAALGNGEHGVHVSASGNTIGGSAAGARNVISGNLQRQVSIDTGANTLQGNHIGTNAAGDATVSNSPSANRELVFVGSNNNLIGGSAAGEGNVISGSRSHGIHLSNASGTTMQGNLIGGNAANTASLGNASIGIRITGSSNLIGGTSAGQGNVIRGSGSHAIAIDSGANTGNTLRGNSLFGNTGLAIDLRSDGVTSNDGAKTPGDANLLMDKPVLTAAVLGSNTLSVVGYVGNAALQGTFGGALVDVYVSNGGQGQTRVGTLTANAEGEFAGVLSTTGLSGLAAGSTQFTAIATDSSGNTSEFAAPATSTALAALQNGGFETGPSPGSTYITRLTGDTAGLPPWVVTGNSVEVIGAYWQHAEGSRSLDLSGNGRGGVAQALSTVPGQTYTVRFAMATNMGCGSSAKVLRASALGNAQATRQTYSLNTAGRSYGTMVWEDQALTFTADSEATVLWFESLENSACGPALDNVRLGDGGTGSVAGVVFEDLNYGGGAGRNRVTALAAGGVVRPNARVELYLAGVNTASFVTATTTDATGAYQFNGLAAASYRVRVLSASVLSSRSGATSALLPVATFLTDASSGTAVDVTDQVGGGSPADTARATVAGASGDNVSLSLATSEAVSSVTAAGGAITGVDFGFNFNTVTNTNDTGAGSLRQVITNANALGGEGTLAPTGRTPGLEHVVFMIANGSSSPGLRASLNLFAGGVATLAPASPLPTLTNTLVLDARTQPGWAGSPVVQLNGASAGSGANGLTVSATGCTLGGLTINRFSGSGIRITAGSGGHTVVGNWLGLDSTGTAASANGAEGLLVAVGGNNVIGGLTAAERNVASGNGNNGLSLYTAGNLIRGNLVGTSATGQARVANGSLGVYLSGAGNTVGGTEAGAGNVISGNTWEQLHLDSTSTGNTVQGNLVGPTAGGALTIANGGIGIWVKSAGNTIGGTTAGAGNTIAGNGREGVVVSGSTSTGNSVLGNAIWGNARIGIDLGNDGATANDGALTPGTANQSMDAPVITAASLSGSTLTVAGYIGTGSGQAAFGGSRVEVFLSDGSSASGAGKVYLGSLTASADGSFSGTIGPVSGVTNGSAGLTATATLSGAGTSEFGPNFTVGRTIAGTVFEDLNYGGGAGRSRADAAGVGVANATVELIGSDGLLKASTTTAADGSYRFGGTGDGHYVVRVVLATVRSSRSGSSSAAVGVQTWRYEASWTNPGPVTDEVGGQDPAAADGAAGVASYGWTDCAPENANCTFSGTRLVRYGADSTWTTRVLTGGTPCTNGVFGDPLVGVYKACQVLNTPLHSVSSASTLAGDVASVDFGFNFDTVVNTNASGAGSLPQVVTNANTLGGDMLLAQAGRSAGVEHVVFMIPNGSSATGDAASGGKLLLSGGLRAGLNAFSGGVASITPGSRLLVSQSLVIDAQTQPGWTANPVVELVGTGAPSTHSGVELTAGTSTVRGLVVNRWPQSGLNAYGGSGHVVQGNWLGTDRTGSTAAANAQQGLNVYNVGSLQIGGTTAAERNVLSGNGNVGLVVVANGAGGVVQGNFIGTNAAGTAALANASLGVYLGSAGVTVGGTASGAGNVISGNTYGGLVIDSPATGVTVRGNRIGTNAAGTAALPNQIGISVLGAAGTVIGGSDPAARNLVSGNSTFGIDIQGNATGTVVQGNHVGPDVTGNARIGNGSTGLVVRSPGVTIGGAGAGNVVSGNGGTAAIDVLATATGTVIQGNTVGLGADGNTALANPWDGIQVRATGVQVGGTAAGAGNVIGGFNAGASGIAVFAGANDAVIEGNTIGLNATRSANRPNGHGVWFQAGTRGARVGGSSAGAANTIAGNVMAGVAVVGDTSGVRIQRNSVWGNTGLGIDLSASNVQGDGVSANDGAQAGGAPNRGMDHAVLTAARALGAQLTLSGYVGLPPGSAPFAGATVDVYVGDGGTRPAGRTWLGSLGVAADGRFNGTVTMPVPALGMGTVLTATATDSSGNTSEFGPGFTGLVVDFVVNTTDDDADTGPGDGQCLTAAGLCSLRAAIAELNAQATLATPPTIAFALPGCSAAGQAACRISPVTVLPTIARALAIDGRTQPGYDATTATPLVELSGDTAPANAIGLVVNVDGVTLRGLVINRWGSHGISLGGSGSTVAGNWFGVAGGGASAAGNGGSGLDVTGTNHLIGGSTPADRNVASDNGGPGIALRGSGNTVTGNVAGLLPDGLTAAGNRDVGIMVTAANQTIGGSDGKGNVVASNRSQGVMLAAGADNTLVQGNCIGVAADCVTPRGNASGSGVGLLGGTGSRITGNLIAHSGLAGVGFGAVVQKVSILGNSIYANGTEGIRLNIADANDGAYNSSQSNRGMDNPVLTGAGLDPTGTALTVFGYIGTGTGQAAFAGARVEVFRAAPDLSGHGEGKVYLGALTADADGRFSGTLSLGAGQLAVGDPLTATATDSSGNTSEFGPNWLTTTMDALSPAGFNAFDADAPLAALTGTIRSKVAGAPATLAVVALDTTGLKLHPGFSGTVTLTWLDARDDSGPIVGSCRSSWKPLGAAGSVSFSANARVTATLAPPANGTRIMRLKLSHTNGVVAVEACSTDAFAVLPASLALVASDGSAATAGNARSLDNTAASGGVVHQAGRPFTLTARALDATGAAMTGYTGTPALAVAGCLLPAGCTAGALTAPPVAAVAGVYANPLVSYAEVGAISLQLTDADYAAVDSADTSALQRTVQSALLPVGRFVPDSLEVAVSGAGRLATANGACMASGQGATFIGQGFGWDSAPQVTVTAKNTAGSVTSLWTGALMKLAAAAQVPGLTVGSAGSATASASFGPLTVTDLGGGKVRIAASATDRFMLELPAGSVQPTVTPVWTWTLAVQDASEAALAGNPLLAATATQAGVPFDRGAQFHSGRLALSAGHGDARAGVRSLLQLQRFTSAGWVTLTEDRGCVTVQPQHLGVELPSGVFQTSGRCAAPMAGATTTQGGRAWLTLPGTPGAAPGRLGLRVAGSAASGNSCTPAGALDDLKPLAMPWLLGGSSGAGPLALLTWGLPNRDVVLRRETW